MVILPSAARTATPTVENFTNGGSYRGIILVIDCTADPAAASVTFTLQGVMPVSGKKYTILASAAITGTGTTVLRVFPGAPVTNNVSANDTLPPVWTLAAVHADTDSITYSVEAHLVR